MDLVVCMGLVQHNMRKWHASQQSVVSGDVWLCMRRSRESNTVVLYRYDPNL